MNTGITVNDYREKYFRRILKKRLIRLQLTCYEEYFSYLNQNPGELIKFRSSLSINVTRFVRNRNMWMYLSEDIFPMIISQMRNTNQKNMVIWSAGCAIGAEPYSISLL